jgi:PST family polysaccharide transporter
MTGAVRAIAFEIGRRALARPRVRPGHRFWGLADQALTSAVSLVTTLIAAAVLAPADFGGFALALTAIYLVNTLQAGMITRPHNQIGAARPADRYAAYTAATALTQVAFSVLTAALGLLATIVAAVAFPQHVPLALALTFAGIAWQVQEFPRRVLYTEGRAGDAFVNDLISYGGQVAALFALALLGHLTATSALVAIGVTSAIGAVVGVVQIRRSLTRSLDPEAVRDNFALGKWLAAAEAAHWTSTQIYFFIAAVLLGPVAAATIRATQVLFGPLRIVLMYLYSILPAALARTREREGRDAMLGKVRRVYWGLVPVLLAYCIPLAVLAAPILHFLYRGRYADAAPVVVLTAVQYFFVCLIPVVSSLLQVEGLARHLFFVQVYVSVISIAFGWLLVLAMGVEGAVLGMAFGSIATNAYAYAVHRRSRARTRDEHASAAA